MADIRKALSYCPSTGVFRWRISPSRAVKAGDVAGTIKNDGYTDIVYQRKRYAAHRLAWFFTHGVFPTSDIDHVNGGNSDNRIENLREASSAQNLWNRNICSRNKSGVKGVCWYAAGQKWAAQIRKNGVKYFLGYFSDLTEAEKVVKTAREKLHLQFTNHGRAA